MAHIYTAAALRSRTKHCTTVQHARYPKHTPSRSFQANFLPERKNETTKPRGATMLSSRRQLPNAARSFCALTHSTHWTLTRHPCFGGQNKLQKSVLADSPMWWMKLSEYLVLGVLLLGEDGCPAVLVANSDSTTACAAAVCYMRAEGVRSYKKACLVHSKTFLRNIRTSDRSEQTRQITI